MISRRNRILCAGLLACNLLFIWGNSLLPASVSGALSQWLRDLLSGAAGESGGQSDGLLRKIAHFGEFCTLGILLRCHLAVVKKKTSAAWGLVAACGCLAACVDEMLQHFSAGRAPRLTDVAIDSAGVLVGIALVHLGYTRKKRK